MSFFKAVQEASKGRVFNVDANIAKIHDIVKDQSEAVQEATLCGVLEKYKADAEVKITMQVQEVDKQIAVIRGEISKVTHAQKIETLAVNRTYAAEYERIDLERRGFEIDEQTEIETVDAKYDAALIALHSKIESLRSQKITLSEKITGGKLGVSCCQTASCNCAH